METKLEREARGRPTGRDVPYAAMGGLTGFSSLLDGYLTLEASSSGELHKWHSIVCQSCKRNYFKLCDAQIPQKTDAGELCLWLSKGSAELWSKIRSKQFSSSNPLWFLDFSVAVIHPLIRYDCTKKSSFKRHVRAAKSNTAPMLNKQVCRVPERDLFRS